MTARCTGRSSVTRWLAGMLLLASGCAAHRSARSVARVSLTVQGETAAAVPPSMAVRWVVPTQLLPGPALTLRGVEPAHMTPRAGVTPQSTGVWLTPPRQRERVVVEYDVGLTETAGASAQGLWPMPAGVGWSVGGAWWLPQPWAGDRVLDLPVSLSVTLPEGWELATSLPTIGGRPGGELIATWGELRAALVVIGPLRRRRLLVQQSSVELVSLSLPEGALLSWATVVEEALNGAYALLGRPAVGHRLLVVDVAPADARVEVSGGGIRLALADVDAIAASSELAPPLVAALLTAWLGEGEEWFRVALGRYFAANLTGEGAAMGEAADAVQAWLGCLEQSLQRRGTSIAALHRLARGRLPVDGTPDWLGWLRELRRMEPELAAWAERSRPGAAPTAAECPAQAALGSDL